MSELRYPARHVCILLLTGLGDVVHPSTLAQIPEEAYRPRTTKVA